MIILLGAPGSGKGTQAQKIADHFKIPSICMGDIVRDQIRGNTKLGLQMKSYLEKGDLVPDSIINAMYEENKPSLVPPFGALLDGFPRTISQAKYLNNLYKDSNIRTYIILIKVSNTLLTERLLKRQRSDDSLEIIKNRLIHYEREIKPIVNYYKTNIITINGVGDIQDVFERICQVIKIKA